ncbi:MULTISPECIES: nitroreductase [Nocardiaceae]|uniref:nitroreductase n=1 Tax=Nocardiaceae TaxID=85025 RepID=UPI000A6A2E98|nr:MULTISPECIES: nitroreductase [Rhodococcus]
MTNDIRSVLDTRRSSELPHGAVDTLNHLMAVRTSCRSFMPEPVPRQTIRSILDTAQRTASWCNSQAWQLSITSGAGTDRLRSALTAAATEGRTDSPDIPFPREYRDVHRTRRRESGLQLYNALGIERGDHQRQMEQSLRNFSFFDAPHVAIVHSDEALGSYGAVDCGGYVSSFLLAATAHGVGSIAQAALAMYPSVIRAELGLATDRTIVCGISFGYADTDDPTNSFRTSRADIDEVVDWIDS